MAQFSREEVIAEMLRRGIDVPSEDILFTPEDKKQQQQQAAPLNDKQRAAAEELVRRGLEDPSILSQGMTSGDEFVSGIKRGASTSAALVTEGVPAIAKSLGNQVSEAIIGKPVFNPQENIDQYQKKVLEAQIKNPTNFRSYQDIKGIGDVLPYTSAALGEAVPQIGAAIVSGGAGAQVGKFGLQTLLKRQGKQLTDEALKKAMIQGATAGALLSSGSQNIPESYLNLAIKGEDSPLAALATGSLKTALDIVPQINIAKKIIGPNASDFVVDSFLKKAGKQALETGVQEGVTESIQTGLDQLAEEFILKDNELFSKDNLVSLVDSGLRGAVGGAVAGGALSPFTQGRVDDAKLSPEAQARLDEAFKEVPVNEPRSEFSTDDSILVPAYVPEPVIKAVQDDGGNVESMGALSGQEVQDFTTVLNPESLNKAETIQDAFKKPEEVIAPEALIERKKQVNEGKRSDPVFIPGDGEIVIGSPVSQEVSLTSPTRSVKKTARPRLNTPTSIKREARKKINKSTGNTQLQPVETLFNQDKLNELKNQNSLSRDKYVEIPIDSFLSLSEELDTPRTSSLKTIKEVLGKGEQLNDLPYLAFEHDGKGTAKVVSHEGRHRALTLKEKGYTTMPVRFTSVGGNAGGSIRWGEQASPSSRDVLKGLWPKTLSSQSGKTSIPFPVKDLRKGVTQKGKTQRDKFYGNFQDDNVLPAVIAENLRALELSPEGQAKHQDIIKTMNRILKEVSGGKAQVIPVDALQESPTNAPLRGAQYLNTLYVALNNDTTRPDRIETLYHEFMHFALRPENNIFSEQEVNRMLDEVTQLKDFFNQDAYLTSQDFEVYYASKEGREELLANVAGKWMADKFLRRESREALIPKVLLPAFRKAWNFITRFRDSLRGQKITAIDGLLNEVMEGRRISDVMDNINYNTKLARMQRIGEAYNVAHSADINDFEKNVENSRQLYNDQVEETGKGMGMYARHIASMVHNASKNPFLGQVFDSIKRRLLNNSALNKRYIDILGDNVKLKPAVVNKLHELGEYLKKTGQKGKLDAEGYLTFERDGVPVKLGDRTLSRNYMQLQAGYGAALADYERTLKSKFRTAYAKDKLKDDNFTKGQVEQFKASLPTEGSQAARDAADNIINAIDGFKRMRSQDYVPNMRFGTFGITVRDADNNQVAFYTIESGSLNKLYDEFQIKETLKEIKEKYSDTTKYKVIGDKGTIKELTAENLKPFVLTYNSLKDNVDPRFLNLEMIASLLASTNIDPKEYETIRDKIYQDILIRGFNKRFLENEGIDGYSKDWNRVQGAYLGGMSNFLSGLHHRDELAILKAEAENIKDQRTKDLTASYIDYTQSAQEDLQMIRAFNFMWTMGGNVSTALLQVVTLPTTTLGAMSQYNPNAIENMALISKWVGVAIQHFSKTAFTNFSKEDGSVEIAFDDAATLKKLIDSGKMTQGQAEFLKKEVAFGRLKGVQAHEYAGTRPYETRSLEGGLRKNTSIVSNYLALPISAMEQVTRFASTMATYDLLQSNRGALERAKKVLKNDYRFQAQLQNDTDYGYLENIATFTVDEAHAVFGKLGRPDVFKNVGGAIFFPFMTYPQQALEFMVRMFGRGADGKRALAITSLSLFMLAGLMGLPGAELAKELYEAAYKQSTGIEMDLDLMIREKVYGVTGDAWAAKALTHGLGRSALGVDVSRRIGLPIPGQDLLLTLLGVRGDASSMLGVQGSVLTAMADAWNEYNAKGEFTSTVAASMVPVAASNILKAASFGEYGVATKKGVQLLTPEEVSTQSKIARLLGFTSDQIATEREELFFQQLGEKKYMVAVDRFRKAAIGAKQKEIDARNKGDDEAEDRYAEEHKNVIMDLIAFYDENDIKQRDLAAFNRSVMKAVRQRTTGERQLKDIRKEFRPQVDHLSKVLGKE